MLFFGFFFCFLAISSSRQQSHREIFDMLHLTLIPFRWYAQESFKGIGDVRKIDPKIWQAAGYLFSKKKPDFKNFSNSQKYGSIHWSMPNFSSHNPKEPDLQPFKVVKICLENGPLFWHTFWNGRQDHFLGLLDETTIQTIVGGSSRRVLAKKKIFRAELFL